MGYEAIHRDLTGWNNIISGPFFDLQNPAEELLSEAVPSDYLSAIKEFGGREGFLGQQYLRLYRYGELIALNEAYEIPHYNPQVFIFAADGYGEAFGFIVGTEKLIKIPLIPIPKSEVNLVAEGFETFIHHLAVSGPPPETDPTNVGLEVHLKKPLCFGGDYRDPENIVMVHPAKHAELARYWNKLYYDLVKKQSNR
jgi:hypothetical protein